MKLPRKSYPTTEASKTILHKKFTNCKLDDVRRNPKEWNTEIKLLRGELQNMDTHIDDS